MKFLLTAFLSLSIQATGLAQQTQNPAGLPDVQIQSDSMTVLYGNSFAERLQENGTFEAYLHAAHPEKKQQFRSLAYTGDQVHFRIRASRFGTHLAYLVKQWKSDRVIICFGMNESFAGEKGLEKFKKDLSSYLSLIKQRHPDNSYILVSPIGIEQKQLVGKHTAEDRNKNLSLYVKAMAEIAEQEKVRFINLFTPSFDLYKKSQTPLTLDGMHPNKHGAKLFGTLLAQSISLTQKKLPTHSQAFKSLQAMVARKAKEVAQAYHPANGISYYGIRARSYEYKPEIPHLLKVANILDQAIWKQAGDLSKANFFPNIPILRADMPSQKPKNGLGVIKTAKEDLKDFTVAKGFEVNCFASSEDFPELINPLQLKFDARGRLWVACFSSYPHPLPGDVANDKILILEDTDSDGKADKKTVFADKLTLPDGFVFYKKGIIASVSRKLIYLEDTDGDSMADVKTELLRGIDDTDTHHSGYLTRNPQGKVMFSEALFHRGQLETSDGVVHTKDSSIMSFDPAKRTVTVERQIEAPNPWKISFDRLGDSIQFYGGGQIYDSNLYNIWTPMGHTSPTSLGMPFRYDKGCSCEIVESPHFPQEWQGGLLTAHLLATNEINFTPLKLVNGGKKSAGKKLTLISSTNKIFRPSDLTFGLDGALYISDFYYPIIGHAQHSIRDKNRDYANGRVWRITRKNTPLLERPKIEGASIENLIELLNHPHLRTRELVRIELENRDRTKVINAMDKVKMKISHKVHALELLWLQERLEAFADPAWFTYLFAMDDIELKRAATKSLRYWAPALGNKAKVIARELAESTDERLRINLVSVISHLQREDPSWIDRIAPIKAKPGSHLETVIKMAKWHDLPSIAAEIPILKVDPKTALKHWTGDGKDGVIYLKAEKPLEVVIGHKNNAYLNIEVNDVPLLISAGSMLARESQNNVRLKKGINKIRYYHSRRKGPIQVYLSDTLGNSPEGVSYYTKKDTANAAAQFKKLQDKQWKDFALQTYKKNCANCHNIDGNDAVGPALNGLLGKKQAIIDSSGNTVQITIDEKYLRESITNPASAYPVKFQPLMPKMPLNAKEIDTLVRWLKELK